MCDATSNEREGDAEYFDGPAGGGTRLCGKFPASDPIAHEASENGCPQRLTAGRVSFHAKTITACVLRS